MLLRILFSVASTAVAGFSQVPAGPPYNAETHPNPIVTFVALSDFVPTTFADALEEAGIEILGLSASQGTRESLDITPGSVDEIEILGRDIETLFYPVVRQRFQLTDGETLTLFSFRDPKPDIPSQLLAPVLNEHAFRSEDDPEENRFGASPPPEQLEVWGSPALLFDDDGQLTLFWQDQNASHVAEGTIARTRLLRLVDDLL